MTPSHRMNIKESEALGLAPMKCHNGANSIASNVSTPCFSLGIKGN